MPVDGLWSVRVLSLQSQANCGLAMGYQQHRPIFRGSGSGRGQEFCTGASLSTNNDKILIQSLLSIGERTRTGRFRRRYVCAAEQMRMASDPDSRLTVC